MSDDFLADIVRSGTPEPARRSRGESRGDGRRDRDARRRRRRRRNTIALVASLVLLLGMGGVVWKVVLPQFASLTGDKQVAEDFAGPGRGSVEVVVAKGSTGADIAKTLVDAGVVKTARAFTAAFTANPAAAGIQPGTYRLMLEMPATDAVTALLNAGNRVVTKVTIPEGLRLDQILQKLSSVTTISVDDFVAAMADQAATGLPAEAGGNYEGWLFGSTYQFEPGTTAVEMIKQMVGQTISVLDAKGVAPADRQRVLITASLVESEARTPEDRAKVARAIQNRLDKPMKLDIDSAVAYGLKKSGTQLTNDDKTVDTPYNLYMHTGLPPTPISSPSEVSIDAVLHPADGPWLYWVTVNFDTYETLFAETLAEHQQNVNKLRDWVAQHSTKG